MIFILYEQITMEFSIDNLSLIFGDVMKKILLFKVTISN